jgi:uncharacterized protein (UPF0264 family)
VTGVLASVKDAAEARIALEAGADIIDLKDPANGALGALPAATIRAAVACVGARRCVSATAGDLPMQPALLAHAVAGIGDVGVDIVKVGIFPGGDAPGSLVALGRVAARGPGVVIVLFADRGPDFGLIEHAARAGLTGVMLDTADKGAGGLRAHLDDAHLLRFVARAREAGLVCGLAGSLRIDDVPALHALGADYLGFRGALCRESRTGTLDAERVRAVCAAVQGAEDAASAATATAGAQRAAHSRSSAPPSTRLAKST